MQANLENSYCSELRYLLKISYSIIKIYLHHFSALLVDLENYICQFGRLWFPEGLYLSEIKEIYDQIASDYPCYQKTIRLLALNYY